MVGSMTFYNYILWLKQIITPSNVVLNVCGGNKYSRQLYLEIGEGKWHLSVPLVAAHWPQSRLWALHLSVLILNTSAASSVPSLGEVATWWSKELEVDGQLWVKVWRAGSWRIQGPSGVLCVLFSIPDPCTLSSLSQPIFTFNSLHMTHDWGGRL